MTAIVLQIAAVVFVLGGSWITGNKNVAGPLLSAAGAAVFVALNIGVDLWIAAGLSALAVVVNIRNAWLWWRA